MKKTLVLLTLLSAPLVSSAATLFHDAAGTLIKNSDNSAFTGGIARFGYFAPTTNFAGSVASLQTAFIELANYTLTGNTWNTSTAFTASGTYGGLAYDGNSGSNAPFSGDIAGENMYLWVLNNSTTSSATQHGIFSAPGIWTWTDADEPGTNGGDSSFSLGIGTDTGLVANIGIAASDAGLAGGHSLAAIGAIPEPSRAFLGLLGLGALFFRRRRA